MPRHNKRDKYEPKEYKQSSDGSYYDTPSEKSKPVRRRKGKWDKQIYKDNDD